MIEPDEIDQARSPEPREGTTDDMGVLLATLPDEIAESVRALPRMDTIIEVIMDLGRRPEARFGSGEEAVLREREIDEDDLQYVIDHVGSFGEDNRAGIERTLHRISAIRNRTGKIVGVTCRVGRAVYGTIEILADLVESGKSILIMGKPGIGKTTMLREAARVIADDHGKRVVIVDTSNEIAGDGDIPHPGIGRARRMQVRTPDLQHGVMIEAVENHMPEVIVIDEIGTELEAVAARTIAERGVQLIGTAHGNNLDNLMLNPTLSDLIGGIQTVTLGDDEARRRRTQKSVLERKAPPTFDVVVEIQSRDRVAVHADVADTVDALLRGDAVAPEMRWRDEAGIHRSQERPKPGPARSLPGERFGGLVGSGVAGWRPETAWRSESRRGGYRDAERGLRPTTGSWRGARRRAGQGSDDGMGAVVPEGPARNPADGTYFRAGEIADRGPLERGTAVPEARARDARELERQAAWRASAERARHELDRDADVIADGLVQPLTVTSMDPGSASGVDAAVSEPVDPRSALDEEQKIIRLADEPGAGMLPLETIKVLGFGVSRKRLEQAIRDLQLPVMVVREPDEADVVITLRSAYKQKSPAIREAEERGIPIYVLKSNTVVQMQACLTNLFVLDSDPRDAAMAEVDEAIALVRSQDKPVELTPQNGFLRRLQHQRAEVAGYVTQSRGREPHRKVRVYPDRPRNWH